MRVLWCDALEVFSGYAERSCCTEADGDEDRVIVFPELRHADVRADAHAHLHLHPEVLHHLHFGKRERQAHLVFGDSKTVQPTRVGALVEDGDRVTEPAQIARAGETGRARADDRHFSARRLARGERVVVVGQRPVGRVTLQQRDLDRLLVAIVEDARAFAEHFDRTRPRARMPHRVGVEDDARRAAHVLAGDLLDEGRDVDMRGTRVGARRVVAVQALAGLEQRRILCERRRDLGEVLLQLLRRERGNRIRRRVRRASRAASLHGQPAPLAR
jgi:hypothetical protein